MTPTSPSDDTTLVAARTALQAFVRTHVAADLHLEVSRLIARYVAESVRRDRAVANGAQLKDHRTQLRAAMEPLLRKNHKP